MLEPTEINLRPLGVYARNVGPAVSRFKSVDVQIQLPRITHAPAAFERLESVQLSLSLIRGS